MNQWFHFVLFLISTFLYFFFFSILLFLILGTKFYVGVFAFFYFSIALIIYLYFWPIPKTTPKNLIRK
jgi:hypothetical protein